MFFKTPACRIHLRNPLAYPSSNNLNFTYLALFVVP